MRHRCLFTLILLLAPAGATAQDKDALALAQDLLERGATLFDQRDATALAATYVEAAEIILIKRDSDSGRVEIETRRGRGRHREDLRRSSQGSLARAHGPEIRSRPARFLGHDLLLIRGRFAMNREQGDLVQFVRSAPRG